MTILVAPCKAYTRPGHETRCLETKSRDLRDETSRDTSVKVSRRLETGRQKSRDSLETFGENFSLVATCISVCVTV